MEWKKVDIKTLEMKPFQKIGSEWMLISASKEERVNTMTASWGGMGIIWGVPAATVYIRPQRYTKEFVDENEYFTLSFFGGEHMKELGYLGAVSGKDEDKIKKVGFHTCEVEGYPTFEEASQVFVCRKMYHGEFRPENFYHAEECEKWYPEKDYHEVYVAEIVAVYEK